MKKYLEIIQEENSDCGISCLASIIKFYGGFIPLEVLRYNTNTSNTGTNAYELINYAKKIGFNSYGERVNNIDDLKLPVIAHVKLENDFFHFVVIYEVKNDYIVIMDPSVGFKKIRIEEFKRLFTNVVINLKPINILPIYKENRFLNNKILSYVRDNKNITIIIVLINILILLVTLIESLEIKILDMNSNYFYILLIIIFLSQLLTYIKNIIILNASIDFNNKIIKYFVSHIFKLPLNYLKLKQKGEITTRFRELNDLSNNILNFIVEVIFNTILILILFLFVININSTLSILLFTLTIIYLLINYKVYNVLFNMIRYSINMEENYNSSILDYITKFTTIKHLSNYNYFLENINNNLLSKNNILKSINKKIFKVDFVNSIIFSIFILVLLYFLLVNDFNVSNSLLILLIINYYINILKKIVNDYPSFILIKNIILKNNEFLSFENNDKNEISYTDFINIKINNLSYGINNNVIFNNFNFEIFNNDKVFINGPSGIGKSTLLKIINNEINNYKGNILFNKTNIKNYNLNNLVSYTSQDEELFNDTILNNLLIGKTIDKKLLDNIIKICRLNEIEVIKNVGLNSLVINSNSFSGGEKNRIILARSLIHSKKIIILDEVLKEVDYDMEIGILKDVLDYFNDRIIIYVSHKDVSSLFMKVLTFRKE